VKQDEFDSYALIDSGIALLRSITMNLIKIGNVVLNVDRINGIQDHLPLAHPSMAGQQQMVTRVLFDQAHIDLTGADAKTFRRWYRHAARDIAPHKDEEGEDLVSPEDQLRQAFDFLLNHIDHMRPRDSALRHTAHLLSGMIDRYITGELDPVRTAQFARHFAAPQADAAAAPDSSSS
jgi:hypothetical protein